MTCLIHPWYKYIHIDQHFLSILKQNQCYKVYETVLIEYNCLTNSSAYELAIIECPCLEKTKTYCTYCRLILTTTTELSFSRSLKNISQQTFPVDSFDDKMNIDHLATDEYAMNLLTTKESTHAIQLPSTLPIFNEDTDDFSSGSKV